MKFFDYMRDILSWALIGRPGPLAALMEGVGRYLDDVQSDIVWLRDQYIVPLADDAMIPAFGESRGVPRTRFDSNRQYRVRVERAYAWQKLGGLETGLPRILEEYGFPDGVIKNLRETDPERWATFAVHLLTPPPDFKPEDVEAVMSVAGNYKPARSKIHLVQFVLPNEADWGAGARQSATIFMNHLILQEQPPAPPAPAYPAAAVVQYISFNNEVFNVE